MAVNTYLRIGGAWVPVGAVTELPPPDPGPGTDPPPQPSDITHGSQIPALSVDAISMIGPRGTLTPYTGPTLLSGTQVIEGKTINGALEIANGANITIRNCRVISPLGITTYTIKQNRDGAPSRLLVDSCEIITRATTAVQPRCITMWGDHSVHVRRTIFRGGIDNMYINPVHSPGTIATGDPVVPMARALVEECWFGEIQRVASAHVDTFQCDGGGYFVFRRNRVMNYNVPEGSDPLTTRVLNPATASMGAGGLITTQLNSNPSVISHVAVRDNWFEGGNYVVVVAPDIIAGTVFAVRGNRWGLRSRFGPWRVETSALVEPLSDNRWGQTGVAQLSSDTTGFVTAGDLLPGAVA